MTIRSASCPLSKLNLVVRDLKWAQPIFEEEHVSSASTSGAPSGASSSRGPLVIVLTVIGILAIIAGILYVSGAANSIHFMVGSVHHGHHQIRAIVSFVIGIACLIGAYIARTRPAGGTSPSASASGNVAASGNASEAGGAAGSGTASTSGTESGSTSTSGS
jgi:hypothetical protein